MDSAELVKITSLEDWNSYVRLNAKRVFLRRYWYALAIGPFVVVILVFHRVLYQPSYAWNYGYTVMVAALGWALLVAAYSGVLFTRYLLIRCPRCNWRFGLGDRCGSCGLPRSANTLDGAGPLTD